MTPYFARSCSANDLLIIVVAKFAYYCYHLFCCTLQKCDITDMKICPHCVQDCCKKWRSRLRDCSWLSSLIRHRLVELSEFYVATYNRNWEKRGAAFLSKCREVEQFFDRRPSHVTHVDSIGHASPWLSTAIIQIGITCLACLQL